MWGALAAGATEGAKIGLGFVSSRKAYTRMKRMYRRRYQWTAQDLEKAGLNRILALTQGPGQATAVPMARIGEPGAAKLSKLPGELEVIRAQLEQIRATTAKTRAEEQLLRAGVPTAEAKEGLMQWLYKQVQGAVGSDFSAKSLLSDKAKKAFGMEPSESGRPAIRIVPKGQKYRGEK